MKISAKEITLVSMFTGLTAIGAIISIPLGEVPITMQSFFVILSGLILGPKLGALSQIVYIILGLIGLPIFANFTGGPQSIIRPGFGFIIAFVFTAYIVGKIAHSTKSLNKKNIWIAALVGTITMYLIGIPYMYYILNTFTASNFSLKAIMKIGCLIFLPGDFLKFVLASTVSIRILPILKVRGNFIY